MRSGQEVAVEMNGVRDASGAETRVLMASAVHGGSRREWQPDRSAHARPGVAFAVVEAREVLEEAALAATTAASRALAIAVALGRELDALERSIRALVPVLPPSHPAPHELDVVSPREREVLALVAEGRSNAAIAEALYVSPNTIKTHVASLLGKLQAVNRAELAAIAARQGVIINQGAP